MGFFGLKNVKLALGVFVVATGCTSEAVETGVAKPATAADAKAHEVATKSTLDNQTLNETRNLVGEAFRVKDSELLRGALVSCMADQDPATDDSRTLFNVPADAIATANNAAPTPGKLRIFPVGSITASTATVPVDIIERKKADLFDPKSEGRESAAAPEATVSYLNAATLVAEVVAHNVNVTANTSPAYCATPEATEAMLKRCVPTITSSQLSAAVDGKTISQRMAEECSKGATQAEKDLNSRVVIASFLGSWLFLKSER